MPPTITRRAATAVTAAAVLTGVLSLPQAAPAAPAPLTDASAVQALAAELGVDRTGGVHYDEAGRLVVAVTDQAAADAVRAAGGVAELVTYSTSYLESIHTTLDNEIAFTDPINGTSWGADPSSNQVVVEIDSTVQGADLARLEAAVAKYSAAARIDRVGGVFQDSATMYGGIGIFENNATSGLLCTAGFNVQDTNGKKYLLTAGHCVHDGHYYWERWSSGDYIGKRWIHGNAGKDYAVIEYLNPEMTAYGSILVGGDEQQITGSRWARDEEPVKRVGTRSSDLVGKVLDPSVTYTNNEGITRTGMIKTSLCGIGGDSGGPLFSGSTALGIFSTSSNRDGPCNSSVSDDRTFYTPVQYVLNTWNLKVY